jgi:hypothetical protein
MSCKQNAVHDEEVGGSVLGCGTGHSTVETGQHKSYRTHLVGRGRISDQEHSNVERDTGNDGERDVDRPHTLNRDQISETFSTRNFRVRTFSPASEFVPIDSDADRSLSAQQLIENGFVITYFVLCHPPSRGDACQREGQDSLEPCACVYVCVVCMCVGGYLFVCVYMCLVCASQKLHGFPSLANFTLHIHLHSTSMILKPPSRNGCGIGRGIGRGIEL